MSSPSTSWIRSPPCFCLAPGTEFIDKLTNGFAVFGTTFANPLPSFHPVDLLIGLVAGALLKLAVYVKGQEPQEVPRKVHDV